MPQKPPVPGLARRSPRKGETPPDGYGAAPRSGSAGAVNRRLLYGLLTGLAGLVLAWVLSLTGLLATFEARAFDWRAQILAPKTAPAAVRLIVLDQASLDWAKKENGLSWPWPREVYAAILDFCRRGGAAAVAFDALFTEPSSYGVSDDAALADAGKRFDRWVLAVFLGRETGEARVWPPSTPPGHFSMTGLEAWPGGQRQAITMPRAIFPVADVAAGAALLGNVSQDPDTDGIYRRLGLFAIFDGRVVPSLALAAYTQAKPGIKAVLRDGKLHLGATVVPLDARGRAIPRWRAPAAFPAVSAAAVIQSELALREGGRPLLDPAMFKDRIVLFGFSAPGLLDMRPSPVAGVTSGVEIHAQALASLLAGDFLHQAPEGAGWVLAALLSLAAGTAVCLTGSAGGGALAVILFLPLPALLTLAVQAMGLWLPLALPNMAVAGSLAVGVLTAYATEGRQKRFIKSAFRQYLSPAVIDQLIAHPERMSLGGELRELTIFFSDLQGFTGISEKLGPKELTAFLNQYLTAMTDIILEEGGTVDKYEGDAIIAFWNAPLSQPDHAERAVRAALRCQDRLAELRPAFRELVGKDVHMRVGLNTGRAVVGNMGSESRFDYTMLGDAVNLASRLEGVNKQFGTFTMMSAATRDAVGAALASREIARVAVVGRGEPVTVHEPLWPGDAAARRNDLDAFARALAAFAVGDFHTALAGFTPLAERDLAAASYAARCRHCLESPPDDWCGVCVLTVK